MTALPVGQFSVEPGHFLYPFPPFLAFYPNRRLGTPFGLQCRLFWGGVRLMG